MPFARSSDGAEIYFEVRGNPDGPSVFLGPHFYASRNLLAEEHAVEDPTVGWVEGLGNRYRLILADYPPGAGKTNWRLPDAFTPERAVSDYCAVADAADAEKVVWIGYSFGGLMGIQMACRTERLAALVCGGFPVLNGPYARLLEDSIQILENAPSDLSDLHRELGQQFIFFLRHLQQWPEREEVPKIRCPRMAFMGECDHADGAPGNGPPLADYLREAQPVLETLGWTIRWIPGGNHLTSVAPEVAVPLVREFLDATFAELSE